MVLKPFLAVIAAPVIMVSCVHTDYYKSVVLKNETDTGIYFSEVYFSDSHLIQNQEYYIQPNSETIIKETSNHEGMYFVFGDNTIWYSADTGYVQDYYRYALEFKKENGELVCYVNADSKFAPLYRKAYNQTIIDDPRIEIP